MVRKSTPSPRILQSSIAALALILCSSTPAFAVAPLAAPDTAATGDGVSILIDVIDNDSDADDDTLQIESVTSPSNGTAVVEGNKVRYTSEVGFAGNATFSYTINDGNAGTSSANVTVTVTTVAPPPLKQVDLFSLPTGGSKVPGAGAEESNVAEDAKFTGFGIPSINDNGEIAVLGRYKSPTDKGTVTAVFAGAPVSVVAKKGAEAPDALGEPQTGVSFSSFRDPLLSQTGGVAFIAKLAGESITSSNSNALFTNAFGGNLIRVIQAGDAAPAIEGATIRKITSVAIASRTGEGVQGAAIFFTAALNIGGIPEVTRADDLVLFIAIEGEGGSVALSPILREGQAITVGQGENSSATTVKSFRALVSRSGSSGQGRGAEYDITNIYGGVYVTTTTGAKAVGYYSSNGITLDYVRGDAAENYGEGTVWNSFGVPTQTVRSSLAFLGTVKSGSVTSANNTGIFAEDETDGFDLKLIVSKGDQAAGITDATFSSFKDPVNATNNRVAFTAKVKGAASTDDQGIWFRGYGGLELVAREGAQPSGVPAGAKWSSFTSLALPDGASGAPLFVAKLVRPKVDEPNPAGILSTNSTGLWARDSFGRLHLIARYGETITVNGESKTVRSFVALKSVSGSPSQNRYFNNQGEIYYRAICTDGTQVLMYVAMPQILQ